MKTIPDSSRRHHVVRVGIFLIAVILIAAIPGCTGTPSAEIRDWYDLDAVRNNLVGSYILMNDLDSTTAGYEELAGPTANEGEGWQPIGVLFDPITESFDGEGFTGSFSGQGREIRDLYINRPEGYEVGLFGFIDEEGVIEDTGVVDAIVTGNWGIGSLAGWNAGTVSNSYSTGNVIGQRRVGGLVGINQGTVSNSYSTGSVTGTSYIGGLVGRNSNGTVSNSHSSSNVTGSQWVGGLVGNNPIGSTVSNSYSTSSVTGDEQVGGLAGWNGGIVSNSYYNYDEAPINGKNMITVGALFGEDFNEWLANGKFLDVNERLSQVDDYYTINDVSDFKQLLAFGQNSSLKFRLKSDLDLATEPNLYIPYLAGEFDGDSHRISNLSLNSNSTSPLGLVGCLSSGAKVTQLGVENVIITGDTFIGGLVGWNDDGTITNSHSSGNVTGTNRVGGLVGWNYEGTLGNCYSSGTVIGEWEVGGLVGWNHYATIGNSYASGNATGNREVGGLVGYNHYSTVSNSYSTGNVAGYSDVGGLAGKAWSATASNCFWDVQTSGQTTSDGGTGKTTAEMQDIATFSGAGWDIIEVADPATRNPSYVWNIVDAVTYPFLSWQP